MNFNELAIRRFSSRKYLSKPIEEEKLIKVLDAGRIAPTAANKQPFLLYVFRDEKNRQLICECYYREWLKKAPVIIVACANHKNGWIRASDNKDHCDIDIAIVVDHMTLQATDLGLATCWICNFQAEKLKKVMNLPAYIEPIVILPLAYPDDHPDLNRHITGRKTLKDLVQWEFQ